jgi:uncharacterized protein YjbI with pentapeptide repeats
MSRIACVVCALASLIAGCEGLGRGIVGQRPVSDAGDDERCTVSPACVALRSVPSSDFDVDPTRLEPELGGDCDGDAVPDDRDPCVGVPSLEAGHECGAALDACARLAAGARDLRNADLRGCRIDAPIATPDELDLTGADLSCARLTLIAPSAGRSGVLPAQGVTWTNAVLTLEAPEGPWIAELDRTTLRRTLVRLRGSARLSATESIFEDARITVETAGRTVAPTAPAVELRTSNVAGSVLYEHPSAWPGRMRIERSTVQSTRFATQVLELVNTNVASSSLGGAELLALGGELAQSSVRVDYGAIAGTSVRDVIFAQCVELQVSAAVLQNVDVPACPAEHFRVESSEILDSRLAGGLDLVESTLRTSTIGGGPDTIVRTEEAELDVVTVCDLGAAAFYGGELRCVRCEEDAFMRGASVCVGGAELYERGCPAIELAPECP